MADNWQTTVDQREWQSAYVNGYNYGREGKFPKPNAMSPEWDQGYDDGRGDFLNSIREMDWRDS